MFSSYVTFKFASACIPGCIRFPIHFSDLGLESNSRTYLQELFGSFSSTDVDVDKIQDNGINDGEYQIYEQDSDDSYSGDDDS